ncbi:proton-coupled folate transporter-like isoform X4 [Schistocerca piceifrons]|uniref:proton-coupled folate transporter-like isoform X4 n=1 Tax=Schistocerca piceifrons TaxID=274613 RepID=UPI001F5EA4FA|nr:proton-coupled folate transporter-like isoform X4 [Schistocerca piceifrons]
MLVDPTMDTGPEAAGSNDNETQMNRKLGEKIHYIVTNITVEPLAILYCMPLLLTSFATSNLNLEKACRVNLEYNSTVCDAITARNISELKEEETKIQTVVANMQNWRNILRFSVPAIFIIFIGSWSDRTNKRKPLLLFPIFGELLSSIGLLLCTYYYLEWPVEVAGVIEGLFPAVTGSNMVFTMALYSYVSDITTEEDRTFRIGIINMVIFLCSLVGQFIGGILLEKVTFYGMFSIAAISYACGLIYCWFYVKEIQKDTISLTDRNKKINFFDVGLVRETFFILFKRRENYERLVLCLLMCAFISSAGPPFGETTLAYFFMRQQFGWDEKDATYFFTYSAVISFIGTLFTVSVLSKMVKLNDCLIGLIVSISRLIADFCYAFTYREWQLYLAQTIDLLTGAGLIPVRSVVSKIVPSDEIGRTFSLMGICEGITTFAFGPLYSTTYIATLETFPGAFFLLGTIFALITGAIYITIYVLWKRGKTHLEKHSIEMDAAQNDQTTKEEHVNEAFQTEEQADLDSKL